MGRSHAAGTDALRGHRMGQGIGRRLAKCNVKLELRPVVIDDGVDVVVARLGQQVEAIEQLDRQDVPLALKPDQLQVFGERQAARPDRRFVDLDLGVAGVGSGVGLGHLRANPVENLDLLEPPDLQIGVGSPDHGHVADAEILQRPVGDHVEIGASPEAAEQGTDQVAAAAEAAGAEADIERGRERQRLGSLQRQKRLDDRHAHRRQLGMPQEAQGDQLANRDRDREPAAGAPRRRQSDAAGSKGRGSRPGRAGLTTSRPRTPPA